MAYHDDLIEQARHLADLDPGRPRQANVRRAVSAAYDAMFHFLIDRATHMIVGTAPGRQAMRRTIARAFQHRTMASVSESFSKRQLPDRYATALGTPTAPMISCTSRQPSRTFRKSGMLLITTSISRCKDETPCRVLRRLRTRLLVGAMSPTIPSPGSILSHYSVGSGSGRDPARGRQVDGSRSLRRNARPKQAVMRPPAPRIRYTRSDLPRRVV